MTRGQRRQRVQRVQRVQRGQRGVSGFSGQCALPLLITRDFCESVFLSVGDYPPKRESRPANNASVLRYAPLGKVAMEAASTKEAAKKRRPKKRLATARTPPVGQPSSQEEVSHKSESEDKSGNKKREPDLRHRNHKEEKHHKSQSPIRTPSICILWIYPGNDGLV
jgi:hypothetical protein